VFTEPALSTPGFGSAVFPADDSKPAVRVGRVQARLVEIGLGAARGGSGATKLQLVRVDITTEDGAQGTGFTYALGVGCEAVMAMLSAVHLPAVHRLPLHQWPRTWYALRERTARLGRGVAQLATSALDIAVWDLLGVRSGMPLAEVLGGHRDDVPVYGSGRSTHAMSIEELVEGAQAYLAEGYHAIKLRVGLHDGPTDVRRLTAVREAVGPDVTIMADGNERLDLAGARWLARGLGELDAYWFEEPLPASDIAGHHQLSATSSVPLAVGEHLQGMAEFMPYTGAAAVLQPDAPLTGGVSEFVRIATLAEAHGLTISPHFLPELHVHLAAASRTATWIEHFPLIDDLLGEVLTPREGLIRVPRRPGHGIIWDDAAVERHTVHRLDSADAS
jgi:L-alanine-DL-glutamate epimerase-like enolase superfamily enzyme